MRGRRLLMVDEEARGTMQGLASGYNWPVRADGTRHGEPENGSARLLIESLECLTKALEGVKNESTPIITNAVNAMGAPYMSALSARKR